MTTEKQTPHDHLRGSDHMLRLAVAAVLEADKEFRSNMMPGWEGDPLSDEIDGLRRIFETSPTPQDHLRGWEAEEKLTVEQAWTILCETPDITSPEEYPDHALITMDQLGSFMARARPELYDADALMADGEIPMTAAENVLAWLLVEKIGVVDDIGYSPNDAKEIIVANIDQAAKQLVEGGELLLQAESAITDLTKLLEAAKDVIASASDTYKKRNGHRASFEDASGEKCWIVPFDPFESLRAAVAAAGPTLDDLAPNGPVSGNQLREILGLEPEEGLDPDDDGNIRTCAGEWVKNTETGLWAFEEDEDD